MVTEVIFIAKEIVKDKFLLSIKSEAASAEDLQTVTDLKDTLKAHRDGCVGMAGNMIGVLKRIIVFEDNGAISAMLNPEIVKAEERYKAEEGCLSLEGCRFAERYRKVKVRFQNEAMQMRIKSFSGFTAQIIQHEIDHCDGILI